MVAEIKSDVKLEQVRCLMTDISHKSKKLSNGDDHTSR